MRGERLSRWVPKIPWVHWGEWGWVFENECKVALSLLRGVRLSVFIFKTGFFFLQWWWGPWVIKKFLSPHFFPMDYQWSLIMAYWPEYLSLPIKRRFFKDIQLAFLHFSAQHTQDYFGTPKPCSITVRPRVLTYPFFKTKFQYGSGQLFTIAVILIVQCDHSPKSVFGRNYL